MFQRKQKQEVIVTAIDLSREDPHFPDFDKLNEDEKLAVLAEKIRFIIDAMRQKHPDAQWIIAWREYGLMGKDGNRTVSREFKMKLKETLRKFASENPNLTIIAGTIAVEKKLSQSRRSPDEKVRKIAKSYRDISDIHDIEDSAPKDNAGFRQVKKHAEQFKALVESGKEFTVVTNACYIATSKKFFHKQDEVIIFKHKKSAPFEEAKDNQVFYPGGDEARASFFKIGSGINIAAEICREHHLGMVKWQHSGENILIHFVLSDAVLLRPEFFQGKYVIQLDSLHKPRLFVTNEEQFQNTNVELYRVNGLTADNQLTGPYAESKIFVRRVLEEIDKMIKLTGDEKKIHLLRNIYDELYNKSQGTYSFPLYDYLERQFTDKETLGILLSKESWVRSFFSSKTIEENLQESVSVIMRLIYEEKLKNPMYQEHKSKKDTSGLK